jgi:hypothetical protein
MRTVGSLIALVAFVFCGSAPASERTDFYLEMQQREECDSLGGRLEGNKCFLPPGGGVGAGAPVYVKNPYSCVVKVAVAYVKPGESRYTVDGWWTIETTYWSGTGIFDDADKPIVHDGNYPLFYTLKRENDEWILHKRLVKSRSFRFRGEDLAMAKSPWGLIDGGYWVPVEC